MQYTHRYILTFLSHTNQSAPVTPENGNEGKSSLTPTDCWRESAIVTHEFVCRIIALFNEMFLLVCTWLWSQHQLVSRTVWQVMCWASQPSHKCPTGGRGHGVVGAGDWCLSWRQHKKEVIKPPKEGLRDLLVWGSSQAADRRAAVDVLTLTSANRSSSVAKFEYIYPRLFFPAQTF